ncbi:hypothetical protein Tco_1552267 [Tanacetum coccineum]
MSAKGEKISGEQSAIYRQSWERLGLADPLSSMAGLLITKGAALIFKGGAHAQTLPFLSFPGEVRIMQISQENDQNRTNTDTGKEIEYKSWENAIKGQQKSTLGQY